MSWRAWIAPAACLALYWPVLGTWFQKDDFAWLQLRLSAHDASSLAHALFAPMAQGTIRVFSVRLFFLGFSSVFGLDAFPYHLWVLLTLMAGTVLLRTIVMRLTGSQAAAVLAPLLWIASNGVAPAATWASGYNQILCSFALLLCFRLRLEGRRLSECAALVFAFGTLETAAVYPAIALAYEWPRGRDRALSTWPLWSLSAIFMAAHFAVAPLPVEGPYAPHWTDAPATLWTYWKMALGPSRLGLLGIPASLWRSALTTAMTAALVCFVIREIVARRWLAPWCAAWFLAAIAPVLPLRDHIIDAYLTISAMGLAMLAAVAAVRGWHSGPVFRALSALLIAAYLLVSIPVGRVLVLDIRDRSLRLRDGLDAIVRAARATPGHKPDYSNASPELIDGALRHRPMALYGLSEPARE